MKNSMSPGSSSSDIPSLDDFIEHCHASTAEKAMKLQQGNHNTSSIKTSADYYDILSNDPVIWGSGAYCVKPRIISEAARRWAASDSDQYIGGLEESSLDSSSSSQKTTCYTQNSESNSFPPFSFGNPLPPLKQSLREAAAERSKVVLKDAYGKVIANFEKRGVMRFD